MEKNPPYKVVFPFQFGRLLVEYQEHPEAKSVGVHQKTRFLVERRAGFAAVELGRGAWPAYTARPIRWVDRKSRTE